MGRAYFFKVQSGKITVCLLVRNYRKDSLFPPFFVALILKKMKDNCRIDTFSKFEIQIAHSNQNTTLTTDHYFES